MNGCHKYSGSLNEKDHLWGRKFSLISGVLGFGGGGGVVRHRSVSCVKTTSKKSVLPNAASHTKGERKNRIEGHF